jgi:predicted exporter
MITLVTITLLLILISNIFLLIQNSKIMGDLSALLAKVQAEETVEASVITLLQNLSAQLKNLPANDQPAIDALAAQIDTDTQALAAAVTANTPAAPAPAPGS